MNSGIYTENNIKAVRRVKRKRRRNQKWLLLLLLPWILGIGFGYLYLTSRPIISYDFASRFSSFCTPMAEETASGGFAAHIAVVDEDSEDAEDFAPSAGLLCSMEGGGAIFSKNAFQKMHPASTTKIMTALLVIKYADLEEEIRVGSEVIITEEKTSMAGLNPGDRLLMRDLLYGLMLPSGNDAANAIAVHMAGDEESFVRRMNEEAASLLAVDTHFTNPHGLTDENHYTSAYDLYLIFREAMQYPLFREVIKTPRYTAKYRDKEGETITKTWENSNLYLFDASLAPADVRPFLEISPQIDILGGKTGTTSAARNCLVIGSSNQEEEYVSVILKAPGKPVLYENMTNLLDKIVQ